METVPDQVGDILDRVKARDSSLLSLSGQKLVADLEPLADFLCWAPYKKILQTWLSTNGGDDTVYLALVKASLANDADLKSITNILKDMIKNLKWGFSEVNERIISHFSESSEITVTAEILERLTALLDSKPDKIACLERLSGIYEKKLFDDQKLHEVYGKIREIDKKNFNALKYFKTVAIQNAEWDEATKLLNELLEIDLHPQDRYRAAHEMATIQLYQLDTPQKAIDTLARYCQNSPLDASTLLYDAYHRIGNVEGCLTVLKNGYKVAESKQAYSVLALRIGELYEQSGDYDNALSWLSKAREHNPEFQVVIERIINLALRTQNWNVVSNELIGLKEILSESLNVEKVDKAISRIHELTGVNHIG